MRLLFINSLYTPFVLGGAERVVQAQAEAMLEAGHEVAVLSTCRGPGLECTRINGVLVWRAPLANVYFHFDEMTQRKSGPIQRKLWHLIDSYNPMMKGYVRRVLQEFNPDVVSCHNLPGWSISAWDMLHECRVPIVQTLHDQYLICPTTMMYRDGKRCATQCSSCHMLRIPHKSKSRKIDTLVGVSHFIRDKVLKAGYFPEVRRAEVIPNVLRNAADAIPDVARIDDGTTVFGFIGRLHQPKGIEFLLDSFTKAAHPGWKLVVAGEGEASYGNYLKQKYKGPAIKFLGQVTPGEFFKQIDFTIVPSLWEDTFPSVCYESLLFGRPVLGSRIGGIPELVTQSNGKLFSAGAPTALHRAMEEMSQDKGAFRRALPAMQESARPYLDDAEWIRKWSELYLDAIAHHRSVS